jgi:hypothetical protein
MGVGAAARASTKWAIVTHSKRSLLRSEDWRGRKGLLQSGGYKASVGPWYLAAVRTRYSA